MFKSIIPKDEILFDMFDKVSENIVKGIEILKKIVDQKNADYSQDLKTVEHQTDEIVHSAMSHLHRTFVTPIDREEIHKLLHTMDDILDLTHVAGSSIKHYKPKYFPKEINDLVAVLLESAKLLKEMVGLIRNLSKNAKRILELTVEINRLENDADYTRRTAIGRFFCEEKDLTKSKEFRQ